MGRHVLVVSASGVAAAAAAAETLQGRPIAVHAESFSEAKKEKFQS